MYLFLVRVEKVMQKRKIIVEDNGIGVTDEKLKNSEPLRTIY